MEQYGILSITIMRLWLVHDIISLPLQDYQKNILDMFYYLGFGWVDTASGKKPIWMRVSRDMKKMACIYNFKTGLIPYQ